MPATTKALLLSGAALLAIIVGIAAGVLTKIDGATCPRPYAPAASASAAA
ncbi:hypothetical protein [Nocardia amamiensis]|nr:hypothetical protein [Nocardia amamiensis]